MELQACFMFCLLQEFDLDFLTLCAYFCPPVFSVSQLIMMNVFARSVQRSFPVMQRSMMASSLRLFSTKYTESHEFIKV